MKTYITKIKPSVHQIYEALAAQLPAKFNDKVLKHTNLNLVENSDGIEVWLPAPYEEYLYKIVIDGSDVNINKSEHYTDDVNSLAMEDVLMDIIIATIGKNNIIGLEPSTGN